MPLGFQDDPSVPGRRVWRCPYGPAALSGFGVAFCGMITLLVAAIPLLVGGQALRDPMTALVMLPLVLFLAALTHYVWRDMRGKMGGVVTLDGQGINLNLPGGRSLVHRPPACQDRKSTRLNSSHAN